MADLKLAGQRYVNSGQKLGIIDGKAYAVDNIYVVRQDYHQSPAMSMDIVPNYSNKYQISKSSSYENMPNYSNNYQITRSYTHENMPNYANKYQITKSSSNYQAGEKKPWYKKPEIKRKRRVAKYKLYSMEGKVKKSFKNGYRWFKQTCSRIIHGF